VVRSRTTAIILAGGTGERMGGDIPKQFMLISGEPVIGYSVRAFDRSPLVTDILIVCHSGHIDRMKAVLGDIKPSKECRIVPGGKTRQESSYNGVKACHEGTEYVLIHDAARPFVSAGIIENVLKAAEEKGAAMPVIDMDDTVIVEKNGEVSDIPDRKTLKRVQTPQGFRYDVILKAHEEASLLAKTDYSDDCGLVFAIRWSVKPIAGDERNIKVTDKTDLHIAEGLNNVQKCKNPSQDDKI
jgi:2-C-methyl-D-erythritol 4-phosphate cytidylyltransferase